MSSMRKFKRRATCHALQQFRIFANSWNCRQGDGNNERKPFPGNRRREKVGGGGLLRCTSFPMCSKVEKDTQKSFFRFQRTCRNCLPQGRWIDASSVKCISASSLSLRQAANPSEEERVVSLYKKDGVERCFPLLYSFLFCFGLTMFGSISIRGFLGLCNQYFSVFILLSSFSCVRCAFVVIV